MPSRDLNFGSALQLAPGRAAEGQDREALHRHAGGLAALGLAADLHDDALAFVELLVARHHLAVRQEGGAVAPDIDQRRTERREQPHDAAEMDASRFAAVAALDVELDGHTLFKQRRAPLARA